MNRRLFVRSVALLAALPRLSWSSSTYGRALAVAARAQLGVTTGYDPTWKQLQYPGGDVSRSTGVCADVVIRAGRDSLGLDLQKLVHEDMAAHFDAYPSRRVWGSMHPDTNIDHRRVLNLETYFARAGAQLWRAGGPVPGDGFPKVLEMGDIVTFLLDARLPHIGVIVSESRVNTGNNRSARVVHNIGRGVEESSLIEFQPHRAVAHFRWPREA